MKEIQSMLLLFVVLCCCSCSSVSSEQIKETPVAGTASGKMTYKGKNTNLKYAFAQDDRDLLYEGDAIEEVVVLLSEQPLSGNQPHPQIPIALQIHLYNKKQKDAWVYIDGTSMDIISFPQRHGFPGCPAQTETLTFKGKVLEGSMRLSADKCLEEDEKQRDLGYEVTIKAHINPPEDKKIALTPRNGKPLPAGGGEAGKTALAFFAVLKNSADLEIDLANARNASPPNENDIKQKQAQLDELFSKVKNLTPSGRNLEEAEPKELFALNVISNLEKYEILEGYISGKKATLNLKASFDSGQGVKIWVGKVNLILENSQWRILRVGMKMQEGEGGEMYW